MQCGHAHCQRATPLHTAGRPTAPPSGHSTLAMRSHPPSGLPVGCHQQKPCLLARTTPHCPLVSLSLWPLIGPPCPRLRPSTRPHPLPPALPLVRLLSWVEVTSQWTWSPSDLCLGFLCRRLISFQISLLWLPHHLGVSLRVPVFLCRSASGISLSIRVPVSLGPRVSLHSFGCVCVCVCLHLSLRPCHVLGSVS